MTRTGKVKNTLVRARRFIADALRGFPFKGIGVSREKVRFRLVKGHQQIPKSNIVRFGDFAFGVRKGTIKNTLL